MVRNFDISLHIKCIVKEHFITRVLLAVKMAEGDLTSDFKDGILFVLDLLEQEEPADVIEREKYIELLKENERLMGDLEFKSEALNSIGKIHKEYKTKIDKAVTEIEEKAKEADTINNFKSYTIAQMYKDCVEILKRNISEVEE